MNDNEDQYKPVYSENQGFTSLIIRGSLVRAQLGPHRKSDTYKKCLFLCARFTPGFGEYQIKVVLVLIVHKRFYCCCSLPIL